MSCPSSLPFAATDEKIVPISVSDRPEICATSATVDSAFVMFCPDSIPTAENWAATVAASSSPNAVPFTAAVALSMIAATSSVLCPRPASFVLAPSMFSARSMPPFAATPATATPIPPAAAATAPIAPAPIFATVPNADDMPDWMRFSAPPVEIPPSSFSTDDRNPRMEGAIVIHAVPSSSAIQRPLLGGEQLGASPRF